MHTRTFRDRRGRGIRGPIVPEAIPRYRTRSQQFDMAVLDAYSPIHNSYRDQLAALDLAVDTVPRMQLSADSTVLPDDIVAEGPVPLGRILPAGVDAQGRPTRARMVIFRQPIEERAKTTDERQELLSWVLAALASSYLNIDPRDILPDFEP